MNKKIARKKSGNSPKNFEENNNYINQKKNIQIYDNINTNNNYQKVKSYKTAKNIATNNKKGINIYKIDDDFNKRQYNQKNKNILINDINKKNNIIIINNIKISNNNNNNNKKNMTIIQNFSKYKKKGEINLVNPNKYQRKNCQNENISNNYYLNKGKNINEEKYYKKNNINLNINNIGNKPLEEKRKKMIYTISNLKKTDIGEDLYTN